MVDLTKLDVCPGDEVPDAEMETCLRVLRTLRIRCAHGPVFRPREALILGHAHLTIVRLVEKTRPGKVRQTRNKEQGSAND